MADNMLSTMTNCQKLYRLEVNFKIDESNFGTLIGRTAHILLIECEPLLRALIHRYD